MPRNDPQRSLCRNVGRPRASPRSSVSSAPPTWIRSICSSRLASASSRSPTSRVRATWRTAIRGSPIATACASPRMVRGLPISLPRLRRPTGRTRRWSASHPNRVPPPWGWAASRRSSSWGSLRRSPSTRSTSTAPTAIAELTARAFDIALAERGPVQVNIPRDYFLWGHRCGASRARRRRTRTGRCREPGSGRPAAG